MTTQIKQFRQAEYTDVWQRMKDFTDTRTDATADEIWLVEHLPVFTQGQAGKAEHILQTSTIPIVQSDRGGQVTYHAPGQIVLYFLVNIKRKKITVREFVSLMEQEIIALLAEYGVAAALKEGAPGVYVDGRKIASLGLRVRKGCTYHGLSLNVDMDMTPFQLINPCGYQGLEMVQLSQLADVSLGEVEQRLLARFSRSLN
ncbi:MAG: lipoyl(octanoyl) transferase LipB [Sinobacterium sp.]|nr:lipoyl(octanoyl) transferase LipB [Sinobacterium sp.]